MSNINIDELVSLRKQVYIRNKTKGILALTLHDRNGRSNRVTIPPTKHPVCLSDMATPDEIVNSSNIRTLMNVSAIELLDPARAQAELMVPGVAAAVKAAIRRITHGFEKKEDKELDLSEDSLQNKIMAAQVGKTVNTVNTDPHAEIVDAEPEEDDLVDDETSNVNIRVVSVCGSLAEGVIKSADAKNELLTIQEDLTEYDLDYIVGHASGTVSNWAKKLLVDMRGTENVG